jgi:hypothetical protein
MLTYSLLSAGTVAKHLQIYTVNFIVNPVKISTLTSLSFKEFACECEHYRTRRI